MKELSIIIACLLCLVSCRTESSQNSDIKFNYKGETPITVFNKEFDFIYKGVQGSNINIGTSGLIYDYMDNGEILFSETLMNFEDYLMRLEVSIIEKEFVLKNLISLADSISFPRINNSFKHSQGIKLIHDNNLDSNLTEFFFDLNEKLFLRVVVNSLDSKYINGLENRIFIGFEKFLRNGKTKTSEILELLDFYYFKDYISQIEIIESFDKKKHSTSSQYGSVLFDLHTYNGTFEVVRERITPRLKIPMDSSKFLDLEDYLGVIAKENDVVMFNEFHSYPHTRFNFMFALRKLRELGYEYLALETLSPRSPNQPLATPINQVEGYYVEEPNCSLMINYAASLGYKLVPYEFHKECDGTIGFERRDCRDRVQAENIAKIFQEAPNSKVLIFGGHAHIEKRPRDDWTFMRVVLQSLFPMKKMVSISQTKYISTNLDTLDYKINEPIIYKEPDSQFDAHLISPFYQYYYEWYYKESELMNHKIEFDLRKDFFTVEVLPIYNEKEIYFPIFKSMKQNLLKSFIYIPKSIKYKVIYKSRQNSQL